MDRCPFRCLIVQRFSALYSAAIPPLYWRLLCLPLSMGWLMLDSLSNAHQEVMTAFTFMLQ